MLSQEYLDILVELQQHHALFAKFWTVGTLVESTSVPTAALTFDKVGRSINFLVNPSFWKSLTNYEKSFVIAHECLHAYFDHGPRMLALIKLHKQDMALANIAADLVVNHYLLSGFSYKRQHLSFDYLATDNKKGTDCLVWVDTIFKNNPIPPGQSLETYFNLLKTDPKASMLSTIDDHSQLPGMSGKDNSSYEQLCKEIIEEVTSTLSNKEIESFEEIINSTIESKALQAGTMAGTMTQVIKLGYVVKKKKWETVIKDVLARFKGTEKDRTLEQWASKNRRIASVATDLLLPSEIDIVEPIYDKFDVWFFQDTSGSCAHLAKRFFAAARSIPTTRFNIRAFCFDTTVYDVNLNDGKLYGFGGTCFRIIEEAIQHRVKSENIRYPDVLFIITDGYGSPVNPQYPERWHWFLTENSSTSQIPATSKVHQLKNFE